MNFSENLLDHTNLVTKERLSLFLQHPGHPSVLSPCSLLLPLAPFPWEPHVSPRFILVTALCWTDEK